MYDLFDGPESSADAVEAGQPFFCPAGHDFFLPLPVESLSRPSSPCPSCGQMASCTPPGESEVMTDLRVRPSHWEQVQQRRTPDQLDALLDEALLRAAAASA